MRIAILTFQRASNYGAVLQAYALRMALKQLGNDVSVVDYVPTIQTFDGNKFHSLTTSVKAVIKRILPTSRAYACSSFARERLSLTRQVGEDEIAALAEEFDAFVVGSDQVWNSDITGGDLTYFLGFVPDGKKRIAYAASFGTSQLESTWSETIVPLINRLDKVSVREQSAVSICSSAGVSVPVKRVLDPTLLIDSGTWCDLANQGRFREDNYVLLYLLRDSEGLMTKAREYAKQHSCHIVCVCKTKGGVEGVEYLVHPSVTDLVALFRCAQHVMTNSFHGICMSIQFKRQITFELYRGTGRHLRLVELADLLGIEDRELSSEAFSLSSTIDYGRITHSLEGSRAESREFLIEAISVGALD